MSLELNSFSSSNGQRNELVRDRRAKVILHQRTAMIKILKYVSCVNWFSCYMRWRCIRNCHKSYRRFMIYKMCGFSRKCQQGLRLFPFGTYVIIMIRHAKDLVGLRAFVGVAHIIMKIEIGDLWLGEENNCMSELRMRMIHYDTLSCEPILRRMPSGELLCVFQGGGLYEPALENRVYAIRSADNGETWTMPESLYPETGEAVYITEVSVIDGVVRAYLTTHSGRFLNMRCVVMESRDSGHSWTNAGEPPHFPTFCFLRSTIETRDGGILIAYQNFPVSPEENARLVIASHNIDDPLKQRGIWDAQVDYVDAGVLRSDDRGAHYERFAGPSVAIKGETGIGWAWLEPTVAELEDGTLMMLIRIDRSGKLWRSDSADGGRTWSALVATDIPNPSNKPKLISLPDGRIALIHTPAVGRGLHVRTPLALWISDDGGRTWNDKRVIADFPGFYCYPDGFYEDGHIYFTIEYNRKDVLFVDVTI